MKCLLFFKQRTAYEMRISDWSSDVCSSELRSTLPIPSRRTSCVRALWPNPDSALPKSQCAPKPHPPFRGRRPRITRQPVRGSTCPCRRSEEHTSELQSLMRSSYAVFCLKKKNQHTT